MIRVCPHSDAKCPHGLDCRFSCATDVYDGTKVLLTPRSELADALGAVAAELRQRWRANPDPPQTLGELAKVLEASLKAVAERVRAGTPLAGSPNREPDA
jgi:hypothetical protein